MTLGLTPAPVDMTGGPDRAQELDGIALTASTRAALGDINLCHLTSAPAS